MKYVVLCPDGAADWPLSGLGNRTPLEAARLPHLGRMAAEGLVGRTQHAVESVGHGSDVCCMSLLGFDPERYHTGRAPLEAKSLGLELRPDQLAVRCNTVTVEDGVMVDYSAGHIETAESKALLELLEAQLGAPGRRFHPGVQYRHLLVLDRVEALQARCTAPHDITGRPVESYLPQGPDASLFLDLMERSKALFSAHPVNQARVRAGKNPATQIWLWGFGRRPALPAFRDTYGLGGALISAVDLLRSLGLYLDLEVLEVPGITGFVDTDYGAKGRAALAALERHDLVFVHVEAPDECGHMGDFQQKLTALERIDRLIVGPLLESRWAREGGLRVLVCPDHSTPCALRTHAAELIPFLAWGPGIPRTGLAYGESAARDSKVIVRQGHHLLGAFLAGRFPEGQG